MNNLIIERKHKLELIHACQELERRGYECISKIQPVYKDTKNYAVKQSDDKGNRLKFSGSYEYSKWRAVYRLKN